MTGKLESATSQSLSGITLFLGVILPLNSGQAHLVNINPDQSPKTTISADGGFEFSNIAPGQYALVLWSPLQSIIVPDPHDSQQDLLVTVTSDQIIDLGVLNTPLVR